MRGGKDLGKSYVENGGTRLVESRQKKYRRSTEIIRILVVTTMGWTLAMGERRGRGERKERREGVDSQKGGTTLSWFPSGGFIMASSYYRRIHGHDANLRQGTKTDLTSARIYTARVHGWRRRISAEGTRDIRRYESLIRIVVGPITIAPR